MPDDGKHLRRLERVFPRNPVYFITTMTHQRRCILSSAEVQEVFEEVWEKSLELYGWSTGAYVIMPDHVHFFCQARSEEADPLSKLVGKWKEWTSKHCHRELGFSIPLWQSEFFDHVVRSQESLREKIEYVYQNPVRASLVEDPEDWQFRGNPGSWGAL